eukprot:6427-Heterococcus_DN1.PRE.4
MADKLADIAAVLVMQLTNTMMQLMQLLLHTLLAKEMVLNSSRTLTMFMSCPCASVAPVATSISSTDAATCQALMLCIAPVVSETRGEQRLRQTPKCREISRFAQQRCSQSAARRSQACQHCCCRPAGARELGSTHAATTVAELETFDSNVLRSIKASALQQQAARAAALLVASLRALLWAAKRCAVQSKPAALCCDGMRWCRSLRSQALQQ